MSRPSSLEGLAPLWWLARARARATLRHWVSRLRRPRYALLLLAVAAVLALYVFGTNRVSARLPAAQRYRDYAGPFLVYMMAVWAWYSARHGALVFTPPEIHFLFPAPVRSRALLLAHLLKRLTKGMSTAFLFALFFRAPGASYGRALLGWGLFILTAVLLQVFIDTLFIGTDKATRRRRSAIFGLALLAAAGAAVGKAWLEDGAFSAALFRYLVVPAGPFLNVIFGSDLSQQGTALFVIGAEILVLAVGVLGSRRDVREAAHTASARLQARVAHMRSTGVFTDAPRHRTAGRLLPLPPRLGGAGIHAWRQLSVLLRSRKSYVTLVVVSVFVALMQVFTRQTRQAETAATALISVLTLGGPFYVQCDFRSDYKCLAWLRSLPTPPTTLAVGQMLASAAVIYAFQLSLAGWILFVATGTARLIWAAIFVGLPVFNLLQLSVWNGAYLLYPTQLVGKHGTPSPGQVLRWYLTIGGVFGLLSVAAVVSLLAGGLGMLAAAAVTANETVRVVTASACGFVALSGVTLWSITAVGRIFLRVDPARDLGED